MIELLEPIGMRRADMDSGTRAARICSYATGRGVIVASQVPSWSAGSGRLMT